MLRVVSHADARPGCATEVGRWDRMWEPEGPQAGAGAGEREGGEEQEIDPRRPRRTCRDPELHMCPTSFSRYAGACGCARPGERRPPHPRVCGLRGPRVCHTPVATKFAVCTPSSLCLTLLLLTTVTRAATHDTPSPTNLPHRTHRALTANVHSISVRAGRLVTRTVGVGHRLGGCGCRLVSAFAFGGQLLGFSTA